ncbi:MAG: hypothetical protein IPH58_00890 [Sphingobacteriales bacterium]|jgi:hypothetical protein|nr:hypothetical protein [Sphingobacteriales bacterium]
MRRLIKNDQMISVSYSLRGDAEAVYKAGNNKKMLEMAKGWAKQANEWFPHFSNEAVYAGLLYKTGEKQKAIKLMEKASKDPILKNALEMQKLIIANVAQMKKGEAPKYLWNTK